jgi:hypothetical protein
MPYSDEESKMRERQLYAMIFPSVLEDDRVLFHRSILSDVQVVLMAASGTWGLQSLHHILDYLSFINPMIAMSQSRQRKTYD